MFKDEIPAGRFKHGCVVPRKFSNYRDYVSGAIGSQIKSYDGGYEIKPRFFDISLDTSNRFLDEDITVKAIEVSRTSNPQGGRTIYIGGNIDG